MKGEAVFISLIIFVILAFLPLMIKGKNNKHSTTVTILTIISAVTVFPSIILQLEFGQNFILILWFIALILSIIGREKNKITSVNYKEHNEKVIDENEKQPKHTIKTEKKTYPFLMIILGIITVLSVVFLFNKNSKSKYDYRINKTNTSFKKSKVSVENVRINKENKYAWSVEGMIRNETSSNIKGYVKIKFLNSSGDIVYTTKAKVNDGDSFSSGQSANFDYFAEPKKFEGVTKFDVEFMKK
jgi:hypothetical protein